MASTSGAQVPKAQSRFDAEQWNDQDTINTIRNLSALATRWIEGLDPETAQQRPDASTWSIAEYLSHIGDVMTLVMGGMQLSIDQPGFVIDELPATESIGDQRNVEIDQALTRIHDLGRDAVTLLSKLPSDAWSNAIVVDGESLDVRWASRHIIYDAWHHLGDIADIRRRLGDGVPEQSGEIVQINSSGGGVPKLPVEGPVHVGIRGLDGDTQKARVHHGRPWQALCLWSNDVIEALQQEGHPIQAGSAGENVTIGGLDWSLLRAGAIVELGSVVCRVTADSLPCAKNNQWFADGDSNRIDHATHPGWSRWYAEVLVPGTVKAGDPVRVR